jgi:hypothetical protein
VRIFGLQLGYGVCGFTDGFLEVVW